MLAIANGSVNPIQQSLVLPKDATVCKHHILSHFEANENLTPMQRIKKMEKQLIRLGVDPKDLSDPDEDSEEELHEMRKDPDKKSKQKPTNEEQIDAMIAEAKQLRKDIEALS